MYVSEKSPVPTGTAVVPRGGCPSGGPRPVPAWLADVGMDLGIRTHFAVSGNTHDLYPVPRGGETAFLPVADALWHVLRERGWHGLLVHDPADGLALHAGADPRLAGALAAAGVEEGARAAEPDALAGLVRRLDGLTGTPVGLLIDYASRIAAGAERLFVRLDKMARAGEPGGAARTPVVWLLDRPGDLPDWFAVANPALRELTAERPDLDERFTFAGALAGRFSDAESLSPEERRARLAGFALETDGMTLRDMAAIAALAVREGIPLARVSEAVRAHRIGTRRNPWKSPLMRRRVAEAGRILGARVKGQDHALHRATDILLRSITGLSGAQTSRPLDRPRGVMFFAGPTGVGKTELAKAITELLFGDESAYHRFDMSEFTTEAAVARLIGAPPGTPGHEMGGELTRAVRARPFGVFLFDEIEKAHPRILDTFLQVLDEGRLTDSRGERVHFSEALVIFTSNIGTIGADHATNRGMNVLPCDSYEELERKMVEAVRDHFRFTLRRPELMNRIGRNIVVFDFVHARSALLIFRAILERVLAAVREEHGVEVRFSREALLALEELCTADVFEGGRGIGNRIETAFVNPLARELFARPQAGTLMIREMRREDGETRFACERGPAAGAQA
jgi:hypothetical protein